MNNKVSETCGNSIILIYVQQEPKKKRQKGSEKTFEEIVAKNLENLIKMKIFNESRVKKNYGD